MKNVYIFDAARTPIGSFGGTLAAIPPAKLASGLLKTMLERKNLWTTSVDETLIGCVLQAGHGQNIARQAAVMAGIPEIKPAVTVNMVCGSGMRSVIDGVRSIFIEDSDLIVAGGTENMSMAPYLLKNARYGYRMGNGELIDYMVQDGLWDVFNDYHMGITAENLAEKYGITREEQDQFALLSQIKAEKAIISGRFEDEIVPVMIPQKKGEAVVFSQDEYPRFGSNIEGLQKLRPAFKKDGTVTAGNSSGINDGAACIIIGNEKITAANNITPMARIVSYGYCGTDPSIMGIGPVEAVRIALKKAGWRIEDCELIEANEAFAAQALAVNKELCWDVEKVNVNGGAIALGHPIGASGARILVTLVYEMKKRRVRKGIAALCIGGGMGIAICVESVE